MAIVASSSTSYQVPYIGPMVWMAVGTSYIPHIQRDVPEKEWYSSVVRPTSPMATLGLYVLCRAIYHVW